MGRYREKWKENFLIGAMAVEEEGIRVRGRVLNVMEKLEWSLKSSME
jgi:hypothetical protein